MRILLGSSARLLTDHLPNGEGLIAWNFARRLAQRGHDVRVAAAAVDLRAEPAFRVVSFPRRLPVESLDPLLLSAQIGAHLRHVMASDPPDVVHWLRPIDQRTLVYPRPLLWALRGSVPLVLGPVSLPWPGDSESMALGRGRHVLTLLRRLSAPASLSRRGRPPTVLLSTPDVRDVIPNEWRADTVDLPLGVDAREFGPTPIPEAPVVAQVGKLSAYKGVRDLVQAFALVSERVPGAKLVLVGDGPERGWIEEFTAARDLRGAVEVTPSRPYGEMADIYAHARVVTSASHGEPFGMSVLEAMAGARPVVAVAEGGPRTLIADGSGGHLYPRGDVEALAARLVELLSDPALCTEMGAFNRARVEETYSWDRVLDRLEETYERVVAAPVRPR